jgi:CheY-like chemotaxis protein
MKKRVLIVDDFGSMRRMMRAALRALPGLEIDEAEHGLAAWNRLQAGGHDLLISDVCMPHLDGWQLVERVRARPRALPIIVVSAEPAPAALPPDLRYLTKPFRPDALREAAQALLTPGLAP